MLINFLIMEILHHLLILDLHWSFRRRFILNFGWWNNTFANYSFFWSWWRLRFLFWIPSHIRRSDSRYGLQFFKFFFDIKFQTVSVGAIRRPFWLLVLGIYFLWIDFFIICIIYLDWQSSQTMISQNFIQLIISLRSLMFLFSRNILSWNWLIFHFIFSQNLSIKSFLNSKFVLFWSDTSFWRRCFFWNHIENITFN